MKSGPLCALLWRILAWCTRKQVTLKARHIPGRMNVIEDKLSRLGQTIQTEWSLHPDVFQTICTRWHQPQVDLFATRFNNKLPQFVSPVPDPLAWSVDALGPNPNYSKLLLFYREVMSNWKMVQYQNTSILEEIKLQFVWYNSSLFNENCSQYFSNSLFQAGIWYINDLYDHFGKIIPFSSWLTRGVPPRDYLLWRKVVVAVRNKIIIQVLLRVYVYLIRKFL